MGPYSNHLAQITHSQFEMEAGVIKNVSLSRSWIDEKNIEKEIYQDKNKVDQDSSSLCIQEMSQGAMEDKISNLDHMRNIIICVGRGGSLVESTPFVRRVAG